MLIMEDDVLQIYIPKVGDRLALKHYLQREKMTGDRSVRKSHLLQRIRKKLVLPPFGDADEAKGPVLPKSKIMCGNKRAAKQSRLIELGWICNEHGHVSKSMVRTKDGGGFRRVTAQKCYVKKDILKLAQGVFFDREGVSKMGHVSQFVFNVWNFQEEELDENVSVGELYEKTGLSLLRFFLISERKLSDDGEDRCSSTEEFDLDPLTAANVADTGNEIMDSTASTTSHDEGNGHGDFYFTASSEDNNIPIINEELNVTSLVVAGASHFTMDSGTPTVILKLSVPSNLSEAISCLRADIALDQGKNIVNVTRHDVLDGGYRAFLRQSWNPLLPLSVKFTGEPAMDDGGVSREFSTMAVAEIAKSGSLFHGDALKYLNLDTLGKL